MSDPDERMVVAAAVATMRGQPMIGSVQVPCGRCRQLVSLAIPGQALLAEGYEVCCVPCSGVMTDPGRQVALAPGVVEEIELAMGPAAATEAKRWVAQLNRRRSN